VMMAGFELARVDKLGRPMVESIGNAALHSTCMPLGSSQRNCMKIFELGVVEVADKKVQLANSLN